MKKKKVYRNICFYAETIKESYDRFISILEEEKEQIKVYRHHIYNDPPDKSDKEILERTIVHSMYVSIDDEEWTYDSNEEFFSDYRKNPSNTNFRVILFNCELEVNTSFHTTTIQVSFKTRAKIESIFEIFEKNTDPSKCKINQSEHLTKPTIFIGHGRTPLWRDLKDHLQDKHDYRIEAYEVGARAGHAIRDILESMLKKSSFAILIFIGEDEIIDGGLHARQNVIHETGLFQGYLGFNKAIVLLEEGVEEFSNIHGIEQIRFSKGNIKETFGEILATLKREYS
jgi:predicted nucleotide-binding protein